MKEQLKRNVKIVWNLEMWYQDNYRKLSNQKRRDMRKLLDKWTVKNQRAKYEEALK